MSVVPTVNSPTLALGPVSQLPAPSGGGLCVWSRRYWDSSVVVLIPSLSWMNRRAEPPYLTGYAPCVRSLSPLEQYGSPSSQYDRILSA